MQNQEKISHNTFKVKVGIFFGYNGENFLGMQYQRDHQNTIENILHKTLCNEGFVLKINSGDLKKIKWSRAARTDKKVHGLCNGVSLKIQISQKYLTGRGKQINFEKIIKQLNDNLPFDLRIFMIKKMSKNFDMRHDAQTRIYNYIIPLKMFLSYQKFKQKQMFSEQQKQQILKKLNKLSKLYLGTHNFHNFSRGYKQKDPRCTRYMISIKVEEVEPQTIQTYLKDHSKEENNKNELFIRFTLIGQSFIYHQIRKMIGLLVKICSQQLDGQKSIAAAFELDKFDLYLAPGEGLYLNRMTFEGYNSRRHDPIQFNEQEESKIITFRAYLEKKILHHQLSQKVFTNWLKKRFQREKDDSEQQQISENQKL